MRRESRGAPHSLFKIQGRCEEGLEARKVGGRAEAAAAVATQAVAPAADDFPAAQLVQTEALPAAYLPAAQAVQLAEPVGSLAWPAGQGAHAVAPAKEAYLPAEHETQFETVVAPVATAYFPAAQLEQADAPVACW